MDEEDALDYGESDADEPRECWTSSDPRSGEQRRLSLPIIIGIQWQRKKSTSLIPSTTPVHAFFSSPISSPSSAVYLDFTSRNRL